MAPGLCTFPPSRSRHQIETFFRGQNSLNRRRGSIWGKLALLTVAGILALNTAATVLLTRASMANYPGGTALALLNERYADSAHGKRPSSPWHDRPINERVKCMSISQTSLRRAVPRFSSTFTHRLITSVWGYFRPPLPSLTTRGFTTRPRTLHRPISRTAPHSRT